MLVSLPSLYELCFLTSLFATLAVVHKMTGPARRVTLDPSSINPATRHCGRGFVPSWSLFSRPLRSRVGNCLFSLASLKSRTSRYLPLCILDVVNCSNTQVFPWRDVAVLLELSAAEVYVFNFSARGAGATSLNIGRIIQAITSVFRIALLLLTCVVCYAVSNGRSTVLVRVLRNLGFDA